LRALAQIATWQQHYALSVLGAARPRLFERGKFFCSKMFFKETKLSINDRSGAGRVGIFHLYTLRQRETGYVGHYVKGSVKKLSRLPPRIRGRRFRPIRCGFVVRCIVNNSFKVRGMGRGVFLSCIFDSAAVLIKRRGTLRSKHIFGVIQRPRIRKKF
jgi:ribosomal protein L14